MPPKKTKGEEKGEGSQKISSFFKPEQQSLRRSPRKRPRDEDSTDPPPPAKRTPTPDIDISAMPSQEAAVSVSPEQQERMKKNKLEAAAKLIAKKLGAESIGTSWASALMAEFKKPYMQQLMKFLSSERSKYTVYPPPTDVFSWTTACAINEVKVVIIGQDPYHGPNQAHGLCFSVRVGVAVPPSLQNMYKELVNDVEGFRVPDHGYLMGWARQGVLLLNACLTVRARVANSHAGQGWEKFTDAVIHWLAEHSSHLVFILWGSYAQKKGSFIDKKKHCVLKSPHPSPLSAHRGFFGSKHFSQANKYLEDHGRKPVDWSRLPKTTEE